MKLSSFLEKVDVLGESECWNWVGYISEQGYGFTSEKGKNLRAHRISYELHVGKIAKGLEIDHLCRNRKCVNPSHLEPVTRKVNILRGIAPSALNAKKTQCPYGHPYKGANLGVVWNSTRKAYFRFCRICKIEINRRWRRRVKEAEHISTRGDGHVNGYADERARA